MRSLAVGVSIMSETESAWASGKEEEEDEEKKKISLHFPGYMLQRTVSVSLKIHTRKSAVLTLAHRGQIGWSFSPAPTSNNCEGCLEKSVKTVTRWMLCL